MSCLQDENREFQMALFDIHHVNVDDVRPKISQTILIESNDKEYVCSPYLWIDEVPLLDSFESRNRVLH